MWLHCDLPMTSPSLRGSAVTYRVTFPPLGHSWALEQPCWEAGWTLISSAPGVHRAVKQLTVGFQGLKIQLCLQLRQQTALQRPGSWSPSLGSVCGFHKRFSLAPKLNTGGCKVFFSPSFQTFHLQKRKTSREHRHR